MKTPEIKLALIAIFLCFSLQTPVTAQKPPAGLVKNLTVLGRHFNGARALATVALLQNYWRHAGNRDFNRCMDSLAAALRAGGYAESDARYKLIVRDTLLAQERSWQPDFAELRLLTPRDTVLHSLAQAKMMLCPNSHATPPAGVQAELVAIDSLAIVRGSLRGKVAYTRRPLHEVFHKAVRQGAAAGIISSHLPDYNRPAEHPASIGMEAIPYVDSLAVFAFKISHTSRRLLDSLLRRGPVQVQAKVRAQFAPKVVREVTAEIIGSRNPGERVALLAHLDEPGANDNASGCATLLEMALALRQALTAGELAAPARTLTLRWVEEIATVQRWQQHDPQTFQRVFAALVLDMVGQDIAKTGGNFLVERAPDPAALWTRPPDHHTEWGSREIAEAELRGTYLNDLFIAACETRSRLRRNQWRVHSHPFEGGSDHVPFVQHGVPAVLAWHFTDVFYHTSGDDLDKVSPQEMANVGVSAAATALFLAQGAPADAGALVPLLLRRARQRLENEAANSRAALRHSLEADVIEEEKMLRVWQRWYAEALASVGKIPVAPDSTALAAAIAQAQRRLERLTEEKINSLRR
ncbi:MAG: M28 family peptidase [candidate division KSB1 bacterium]|nr:M28 family peptidase [candidate division KSB1 bacterium]MDZ7274977.1 M28 family peptidase [candidate division KSB1 bacterium]MDZ7286572.1 M28 family peptidase [candidate division KSB1 bacterium]MDZ7299264.1 M28 family peptidase [candidate division KSB1 bacterium]MDZ7306076.1 M28 family peptidase [candidate division KSB1 bacterium]